MNNIEFVLKDKFSYMYAGYDQFYLVDDKDTIHNVDKMVVKSVYLWKIAKPGNRIYAAVNGNRINIEKIV